VTDVADEQERAARVALAMLKQREADAAGLGVTFDPESMSFDIPGGIPAGPPGPAAIPGGGFNDGPYTPLVFGRCDTAALAYPPKRSHPDDAGFDLSVTREITIPPGQFMDLPTNVWVALPPGWWGLITGRSSSLRKLGLLVHSGVIDTGYRGELYGGAFNLSPAPVTIHPGDRVAQFIPIPLPDLVPLYTADAEPPPGSRGEAGFGSTGR